MLLVACFIKEGFMKKKSIRLSYSYTITAVICTLALLFSFVANSFALNTNATAQSKQQQSQNNQQNTKTNTPPPLRQTRSATPTNNAELPALKPLPPLKPLPALKPLDEDIYGKVDVSKWNIEVDGENATIKSYTGDKKQIVVPTLKDLKEDNRTKDTYKNVTSLGIKRQNLSDLVDATKTNTIAISHNGAPIKMLTDHLYALFISKNLTHIDLANLNTDNVKNLRYAFFNNLRLQTIEGIERWNVSNVTNLEYLFAQCSTLMHLPDLSHWDTSKVMQMNYTFYKLKNVPNEDLSFLRYWKTDNVTTMDSMFAECNKLKSVEPLSYWKTSNVTNMREMFWNLDIRDLSPLARWDVSKVTDMGSMFNGNDYVENLSYLSNWKLNKNVNMTGIFTNLTGTLIAKGWQSVKNYADSKLFIRIINSMAQGEEQGPYSRSGIGAIFITDGPFVNEINSISGFHHCVRLYHSRKDYDDKRAPFETIKMPVVYYSTSIDASNKDAQRNVVLAEAKKKVDEWIKEKEKKDNKKYVITDTIFDKFKSSYNDAHLTANASFVIEEVKYKKTITQTITVHDQPDEPEYTIIRKREIHRTLDTDKQGNKVLSPWSKAVFKAFTLRPIEGYSVMPVEEVSTTVDIKDDAYYVPYNKPKPSTPPSSTPTTTDTGTQTEPEPKKPDSTGTQNNPSEPRIVYVPYAPEAQDNKDNNATPACNCDCNANSNRNNQHSDGSNNAYGNKQDKAMTGSLAKTGATTQSVALLLLLVTTAVASFLLGRICSKKRKHAIK